MVFLPLDFALPIEGTVKYPYHNCDFRPFVIRNRNESSPGHHFTFAQAEIWRIERAAERSQYAKSKGENHHSTVGCFGSFERKELDNVKKQREQWTREIKPKIEKDMEQRQEKLQEECEKFQMAVSDVMDKWICQVNDEGQFSIKKMFGRYLFLESQRLVLFYFH